ncbi:hypothetical protein FOQG_09820 [Fusarium oxysporum f. sp. raphani 54005]|uniref:alpha-L-rhamnosidase n=2 Tax=Fusarium oxysporum f. sp. raphani TaxID=96318 RepID=X0CVP1_FUSOX|nr:hypothetical protein FOQG_09820 [Fusarium oxysporum f. sp. raphani 54005]KAG7428176.1 hypothetical protein Forpi1262_v010369 [Fusarium oxysporum f. sp. raphani]KAJ4049217.1 hypothetical protein NW753_008224 [Fusarium oxysporum]KAJ4049802.1 hypothetical protein NW763_009109 [Fusarium oxysporum]KAJ4090097.1 hypothetical protein NW756_006442 [Fusarium oxysporum]
MALSISRVSFEHYSSPLGIAETAPRISWRFDGDAPDWEQSSYDIQVSRSVSDKPKSFSSKSSDSLYQPWPDIPLEEAQPVSVRVRAHGQSKQLSTPWSDWVSVETGLFKKSWENVKPIASTIKVDINAAKRPVYFRKDFKLPDDIASARLYITALGIYEAEINGKRVGDRVLAPGWQSFHHRHVYDTYDVTKLLTPGSNAIGALVGEGWYAGRMGFAGGQRNIYGNSTGLLAQLHVKSKSGKTVKIVTDTTWKSGFGPATAGEIYNGDRYNATLEADIKGWSKHGFKSSSWSDTRLLPAVDGELVPAEQPPVRRVEEVKPQRFFKSASGKQLVDFGQNLVGWLRLNVDGPKNTTIRLRHAEVLEDGELALRPLRLAKAEDYLTLSGKGSIQWEPKFTFHGFRYAELDGWPKETPLDANSVKAIVVHTDLEETGYFNCSNPLLNKFHSNVRWSMKGNFLSIPTDCPQRDERLGWTGDAHAFCPTSNYLYDTSAFWKGWHKDIWSEMSQNEMVPPFYVPSIPWFLDRPPKPASVWGDVVVANPWNIYQAFGDKKLLQEHLPQAQNWIDTGISRNDVGLWNRSSFQFGDWLDPLAPSDDPGAATTHKILVSDAYLIKMTETLSQIIGALGDSKLAKKYQTQRSDLKREFQNSWAPGGKLANRTQTAYALSLAFDLLKDDKQKKAAADTLRDIIKNNDYLVGTGFAGTSPLGFALTGINATDVFYRMLLQEKVPSWLYQVVMGGTTTWERWDSMLPNGTVNPGEMTSFNHYSFGSVANWMHQVIGGIAPLEPGYKTVAIAPIPGGNLSHASATYVSQYGTISTDWTVTNGKFHLKVRIPPNTKAKVTLPGTQKTKTVGSGYHEFTV